MSHRVTSDYQGSQVAGKSSGKNETEGKGQEWEEMESPSHSSCGQKMSLFHPSSSASALGYTLLLNNGLKVDPVPKEFKTLLNY